MSTYMNLDWDHKNKDLFLAQELGLSDYVNVAHPRLEELALKQRSQFWVESEISLENDKRQWPNLPKGIQDVTLLNLAWQTQTDSFVSRAPEAAIGPLISRPELEGLIKQWAYFEDLHSRAYSNIIRNVLTNPSEFIDSVSKNMDAFARIADSVQMFDKLHELGQRFLVIRDNEDEFTSLDFSLLKEEVQEAILNSYFAVYGLEAMQFYASFACTFALAENDILTGIAKNIQLIAKDEALHTVMSMEIINILYQQFPKHVVDRCIANAPAQLLKTLEVEITWAKYIFSEGREIMGLNAESLEEYLYFIGYNAFTRIGVPWPSHLPVILKNPIPWINNWLDAKNQQVAPQENQITNYKVGSVIEASEGDVDDLGDEFKGMF